MASFEKMREILPQKNILQALFVAVGIVIVALLVRYGDSFTKDMVVPTENENQESITTILGKDSDADGLKDWEEALWGTNPHMKDSDGDGTSDKLFVDETRQVLLGTTGLRTSLPATTTSDILGRQIFATLVSLNQSGSLNNKTLTSLTEAFAKSIEENDTAISLSLDKLPIVPTTPQSKKLYREKLISTLSLYKNARLGEELTSFGKTMQTGDAKNLDLLIKNKTLYNELSQKLLVIPTPTEIAEAHILLVTSYARMAKALGDMEKILHDPVVALFGIGLYEKASSEALVQMQLIELSIKEW